MSSRRQGILGLVLLFAGFVVFAAAPVMAQPSDPAKDTWVCHYNTGGSVDHWETLVVTAATAADLVATNPDDFVTTPGAGCPANVNVAICYPVGTGYEYREVDAAGAALAIDYEGAALASSGLCVDPGAGTGGSTPDEPDTEPVDDDAGDTPSGDITVDDGDETEGETADETASGDAGDSPANEEAEEDAPADDAVDGDDAPDTEASRPGAGESPEQVDVRSQTEAQPEQLARTGVQSAQTALYALALLLVGAGVLATGRSLRRVP